MPPEIEVIPPETMQKQTKTPKMCRKTIEAMNLVTNHDVDPKTAMMFANGGKDITPKAVRDFKEKVRKYSLTAPSLVKMARNAIKDTLQGKEYGYKAVKIFSNGNIVPYTEKIVPSYTNKLAAAAMVLDRDQPMINRSVTLNINADLDPIDLDKFRNTGG